MNASIRDLLGVSLREESRWAPVGLQIPTFALYLVFVAGLAWVGGAISSRYGGVIGIVLGVLLGSYVATAIFRSYRVRHQGDG